MEMIPGFLELFREGLPGEITGLHRDHLGRVCQKTVLGTHLPLDKIYPKGKRAWCGESNSAARAEGWGCRVMAISSEGRGLGQGPLELPGHLPTAPHKTDGRKGWRLS